MARNPTFNLKTGADSDLIVAREVTQSNDSNIGKIKRKDGIYTFPYLTRRTGDTLTGTTENIESNELRHGRTRSAPRKGTSSSSGDINFEFSAETFDDMMEAAFRGKWKPWTSDTDSPSNKKGATYAPGYFDTKCATDNNGKLLIGAVGSGALIESADADKFVIHELNSATNDIKYSLLRKYGGQVGEDLWQEFTHMAVNNMQLSVEINSIITGAFGFMGTNNPKLLNSKETSFEFEERLDSVNSDLLAEFKTVHDRGTWSSSTDDYKKYDLVKHSSKYYIRKADQASAEAEWDGTKWDEYATKAAATASYDTLAESKITAKEWASGTSYLIGDAVYQNEKWYRCIEPHTASTAFATDSADWKLFDSDEYFASIPDHATNTMQFTAREGFLYINGKQIEFAQSLSFNLDNGLTQKFAIFVPNAISTAPLALDITGDLSTYVVGGESDAKKLFNDAINNETIELLFCLQDKLEDPTALYIFQIFNAKHTENTINGNGEDTFDESLPWQSFDEQACRVFKILLPRFAEGEGISVGGVYKDTIALTPNTLLSIGDVAVDASNVPTDITISIEKDNVDQSFSPVFGYKIDDTSDVYEADGTTTVSGANVVLDLYEDSDTYGQVLITHGIAQPAASADDCIVSADVSWNGMDCSCSFTIPKSST